MKNFFRVFIAAFAVTLVAAAVALFFYTERSSKALNDVRPNAEAMYSNWEKQSNCLENPQPCADYSQQFTAWLSQFEQYKENKEQRPLFQYYKFLKELDGQYASELNSGGLAALALASSVLLLFVFSIVHLLGGQKKAKTHMEIKIERPTKKPESAYPRPYTPQKPAVTAAVSENKPDINMLLRKATECSEDEPMQAISYLEQAIEGSLSTKLSLPALLLCGSLRLKNKIGEDKGREQLQKILSAAPASPEAEKAKTVLDTFK
jgi:hypothetical protein